MLRARGRLTHPLALALLAHLTAKAHVVATTFVHILGLATGRGPEAVQAGGCKIALDPSRAASLRARGRLTHALALPLLSHVTEKTLVVAATVVHIFGSPTGRGHDHGPQKRSKRSLRSMACAVCVDFAELSQCQWLGASNLQNVTKSVPVHACAPSPGPRDALALANAESSPSRDLPRRSCQVIAARHRFLVLVLSCFERGGRLTHPFALPLQTRQRSLSRTSRRVSSCQC